jgi:hypothetical protein
MSAAESDCAQGVMWPVRLFAPIAKVAAHPPSRWNGQGDFFFPGLFGGRFGCSEDYVAMARLSTRFVDQILKGTRPGDLAAEFASDYKVAINLKTAKELGLTVPPSLIARANQVIE